MWRLLTVVSDLLSVTHSVSAPPWREQTCAKAAVIKEMTKYLSK